MRISAADADFIVQGVRRHLGDQAGVWVFGSRLDDEKRGGDLDLYVEAPPHSLMDEVRCKLQLEEALDMPIDLVVRAPGDQSAIARIAKIEGVAL